MSQITRKGPGDFEPPQDVDYAEWAEQYAQDLAEEFVLEGRKIGGLQLDRGMVAVSCEAEASDLLEDILADNPTGSAREYLEAAMVRAVVEMIEDNAEACYNHWKLTQGPG